MKNNQTTHTRQAATLKESSDSKNLIVIINSTSIDTHKTLIDPDGGDLTDYKRNPVVLFNHNLNLPLANGANLRVQDSKIIAEVPYENFDNEDAFVVGVVRKLRKGIIRAASIGFTYDDKDTEVREDEEGNPYLYIRKWKLLEFSLLSVGSNPDALIISRNPNNNNDMNEEFQKQLDEMAAKLDGLSGQLEAIMTDIKLIMDEVSEKEEGSEEEERENDKEDKEEREMKEDEDKERSVNMSASDIQKIIDETISNAFGVK